MSAGFGTSVGKPLKSQISSRGVRGSKLIPLLASPLRVTDVTIRSRKDLQISYRLGNAWIAESKVAISGMLSKTKSFNSGNIRLAIHQLICVTLRLAGSNRLAMVFSAKLQEK